MGWQRRDELWKVLNLVLSMPHLYSMAKYAPYLYRFWVPLRMVGRHNGVSSASLPHWTFRGQTCQVLDNTWGHGEEQPPVWPQWFLSPKQYQSLGFHMASNTFALTLELVGICGEFLKNCLVISTPCIKQVWEVNQVICYTCLNEW